ncbi:FAD-dependent monooxygenase [Paenibacillus sp. YAF4_2]|uniref:FAD-dependent monooxygenase n=1 Tax=Paenibacillus sp. YAF4_2 TaxID=3233085 RepID=UPI003F943257
MIPQQELSSKCGLILKRVKDGTSETIRLVGADGGASTVRKTAGIPFIGETNDSDRTLLIDANIDGLSRKRWHIWPRKQGKAVGACPLPHSNQFQIMIRLTPDETPDLDEAALAANSIT